MKWALVFSPLLVVFMVAVSGVSARPTVRAAEPRWQGVLTASYVGVGREPNGNCPSCFSSSREHVIVHVEVERPTRIFIKGSVALIETVDYNSQCGGKTTRTEVDVGQVAFWHRQSAPISVQLLGKTGARGVKYSFSFNPPGIPYRGTITSEVTKNNNGQVTCGMGTHRSSGVYYMPAFDRRIYGYNRSMRAISGGDTYSPKTCQVPRKTCMVTYSWRLRDLNYIKPTGQGK